MAWKFDGNSPVFMQIAERLRSDIFVGRYAPDDQIPSVRQLAFEASVNPNTVQHALSFLESEGLIVSKGTVGRFVTSDGGILERSKELFRRGAVHKMLETAKSLGITKKELIDIIKEEDLP